MIRHTVRITARVAMILACSVLPLRADEEMRVVEANRMIELSFSSAKEHADPFGEIELDVIFAEPGGRERRVPAFWAGDRSWRARYASGAVGVHAFRTECSDADDPGLHGVEGRVEVVPYRGDNPLYRHGPLRVAEGRRHFEHADGTPFLWLGDTWWMGLSERLRWPDEFRRLAEDRRAKGFNVIQIVAGLYPDMPAFDPRGRNEAGFPWTPDYGRINPAYFDAADRRLVWLADHGFVPCVVGAWGYHLPWMGVERMKAHWRYVIARYGALPVVWCVAGEANLPYYLAEGFPFESRPQVEGWTEVARHVHQADPFDRPVTIHPTGLGRLSSRGAIADVKLLDFDMLQTGHGDVSSFRPTLEAVRASYAAEPTMPVLNSEVCYEQLLGRNDALVQRLMAWTCLLSGAAGHTYGANGIWQLNRAGRPYGPSPHGGDYGPIPWEEAMHLPGSRQVGLAREILDGLAWPRFEPHPEWVAFTGADPERALAPTAAGIPGRVRVLYLPTADPAIMRHLEPGSAYRARFVDPATGRTTDAGTARPGDMNSWPVPDRPDPGQQDWLLILEAAEK